MEHARPIKKSTNLTLVTSRYEFVFASYLSAFSRKRVDCLKGLGLASFVCVNFVRISHTTSVQHYIKPGPNIISFKQKSV